MVSFWLNHRRLQGTTACCTAKGKRHSAGRGRRCGAVTGPASWRIALPCHVIICWWLMLRLKRSACATSCACQLHLFQGHLEGSTEGLKATAAKGRQRLQHGEPSGLVNICLNRSRVPVAGVYCSVEGKQLCRTRIPSMAGSHAMFYDTAQAKKRIQSIGSGQNFPRVASALVARNRECNIFRLTI